MFNESVATKLSEKIISLQLFVWLRVDTSDIVIAYIYEELIYLLCNVFVPGFLNVVSSVSKTHKILRGMSGLTVPAYNGLTVHAVEETEVAPRGGS